jgi:hypothetical protein
VAEQCVCARFCGLLLRSSRRVCACASFVCLQPLILPTAAAIPQPPQQHTPGTPHCHTSCLATTASLATHSRRCGARSALPGTCAGSGRWHGRRRLVCC